MTSLLRRSGIVALTLFLAFAATGLVPTTLDPAPSAHAQTYRFWSYWHAQDSSWTLATEGPSSRQPAEGSVEGWRFTMSSGNAGDTADPRPEPSFGRICAGTPAQEGTKRVAVVLDYGTTEEAPGEAHPPALRTACARVPPDGDGSQVLAAIAEERYLNDGRVCSIDGYPRGACGDAASKSSSEPSATATTTAGSADSAGGQAASGGGLPASAVVGTAIGGVLVAVLGGAAVSRARRSG